VRTTKLDFPSSTSRTSFFGGVAVALAGPAAISALASVTDLEGKPGPSALFLIAVLVASVLGGVVAGFIASLASFFGLSYFFITPQHGFTFDGEGVFALVSFLLAALLAAAVLDRERRALDRLRTSTGTLGIALQVSGMGAWEWRPDSGRVWLSREAERLLGLEPGQFPETLDATLALVHPDDVVTARRAMEQVVDGATTVGVEIRVVHPAGRARWLEVRGSELSRSALPSGRRFVGVLADVTDRHVHAKERDHQIADLEEARQRIGRLQAVTEALSEAATRTDVANVLVREGLVALRAQAGAVFQLVSEDREFESIASTGYPEELREQWERFDATAEGPAREAVRTGNLIVTTSAADLVARWPHLAEAQHVTGEATITAPLIVGDDRIGVMYIAFRLAREFQEEDLAFVQTLARQCAQALERARLYEEELHAREQAERLAGRLRRLQTVVDATFASGSLDELLERLLTRLRDAVESDTATILILDEQEQVLVTRESVGFAERVTSRVPVGEGFAGKIAAQQRQLVVPDTSQIETVGAQLRNSGVVSLAGVPLVTDGRTIGVVHVGMRTPREFDREDVLLLRLVAARAAVAIDRAQVHEREHRIAEILQRSLLPERLPAIEGVEAAARYVPGTVGVAVGGDWYDVFALADGSIGIAVGDVVGHGVRAAATMGRLRNVLRAYAIEGFGPAEALTRLNRLACEGGDDVFATVVFALLAPSRSRLRLASAGHLPPLLRAPDGSVRLLDEGRSLPIGAAPDTSYVEADLRIEPGSSIVLYTDGLVERRGESIDVGIARLVQLVERSTTPVDELADRIVDELEFAEHTDDVALVAVRLEPLSTPKLSLRFPAEPASLAPLRSALRSWLESHGAADDEVFDILVAVNEACSNAVEHPIGRNGHDVGLDADVIRGEVLIDVRDHGRWRPAGPRNDRGRGFELMQALMENVDVARSPVGTHVRLRRQLRQR
jgi:serine phosphatase RsbU (regulator of sigma subunit)/anti-sigma regulatory factor (Ser/Thr protein kinase)/PAS domain-containing protein